MRRLMLVFAALTAACESRTPVVEDTAAGEVVEAPGVQGSFVIGLAEWKVDSPVDTLPAGRYTFRVENTGTQRHALEVEGNGKEWETGDIAPGSASELTVELKPGTYELYCPVESNDVEHEERGMKRLLVVKAS